MARVVGIVGWKNSGKTTLTERLVSELVRRGHRVSTVKHAHHDTDIDRPGKDTHRHRTAGATEVALVTAGRWALMHELRDEEEPSLADILSRLSPCDFVLVEGYKREHHPMIETRRTGARQTNPLGPDGGNVVAIAADHETDAAGLPLFGLDDIEAMADLIERL